MFTPQEFKDFFKRDFPYCPLVPVDPPTEPPSEPVEQVGDDCVSIADIERAMDDAVFFSNGKIGCLSEEDKNRALMYLTAHYLITNLKLSSDGIDSSNSYGVASQSVGNVSVSYQQAPEYIQNNPWVKGIMDTGYGQRFFDMAYRCMLANRFFIVRGRAVS